MSRKVTVRSRRRVCGYLLNSSSTDKSDKVHRRFITSGKLKLCSNQREKYSLLIGREPQCVPTSNRYFLKQTKKMTQIWIIEAIERVSISSRLYTNLSHMSLIKTI